MRIMLLMPPTAILIVYSVMFAKLSFPILFYSTNIELLPAITNVVTVRNVRLSFFLL